MRLTDRVAIVTGAGRGIGRQIAITFADEGARVAIVDINAESAMRVADEIRAAGGVAISVSTDITAYAQVEAMAEQVSRELGTADILVNNAVIGRAGGILETTQEDWHITLDVSLTGYFNCSQVVARQMMNAKGGSIINLTSIVAQRANSALVGYISAKTGVIGLTISMAVDLGPKIRVNAIAPGVIETELSKSLIQGQSGREDRLRNIPMGHFGRPLDIAKAAVFLVSDDAAYITGQVLNVDGGFRATGIIRRD